MKTKKLLFELIEIDRTLYNISYTIFCICISILLFFVCFGSIVMMVDQCKIPDYKKTYLSIGFFIICFIISRMFHKHNYS